MKPATVPSVEFSFRVCTCWFLVLFHFCIFLFIYASPRPCVMTAASGFTLYILCCLCLFLANWLLVSLLPMCWLSANTVDANYSPSSARCHLLLRAKTPSGGQCASLSPSSHYRLLSGLASFKAAPFPSVCLPFGSSVKILIPSRQPCLGSVYLLVYSMESTGVCRDACSSLVWWVSHRQN